MSTSSPAGEPTRVTATPAADPLEPAWQDVLPETCDFVAVVRPKSLREDRIYGPLFRYAVRLARDRSKVVAATRMADSVEDANEVVLGVTSRGDLPAEVVLVENGVRADVDPAKLVDDDGALVWSPGTSGSVVHELVRERDGTGGEGGVEEDQEDASLFELPGRSWVIVSGAARDRAREVLAHPRHRPLPDYDAAALALVRLDGPSLVAHVPQLRGRGPLSVVGDRLVSVVLTLPPGADHAIRASLEYTDEVAAAAVEAALRQTFSALARAEHGAASPPSEKESPHAAERTWMAWLGRATVERSHRSVVATAPLPPELVSALLEAGGSDPRAPAVAPPPRLMTR